MLPVPRTARKPGSALDGSPVVVPLPTISDGHPAVLPLQPLDLQSVTAHSCKQGLNRAGLLWLEGLALISEGCHLCLPKIPSIQKSEQNCTVKSSSGGVPKQWICPSMQTAGCKGTKNHGVTSYTLQRTLNYCLEGQHGQLFHSCSKPMRRGMQ